MPYRTHLFIDLDLDATPIAGHITSDHNPRRPFHGWLELSSVIEERRTAGLTTARTDAPSPSTPDRHAPTPSRAAPPATRPESGPPSHDRSRDAHHQRVVAWLAECTQPRWILLGAWTCAGWSTIAVPVLAATRHTRVLAWWALGLLAILVLLTHLWTEQPSTVRGDEHDQRPPAGPRTPPPNGGLTGIDWHRLEQEMLAGPPNEPMTEGPGHDPPEPIAPHKPRGPCLTPVEHDS